MKKLLLVIVCCVASCLFSALSAWALEVYCVGSAAALQEKLNLAATDGDDSVIKVIQGSFTFGGTYVGNFEYESTEGKNITIRGGYAFLCINRDPDPTNTILDGGGSGRVLSIKNEIGDITVEGVTIKNGYTDELLLGSGAGLYAYADSPDNRASGNVNISNCIITENTINGRYNSGAGLYASSVSEEGTTGDVSITDNVISENSGAEKGGGAYASTSTGTSSSGQAGSILFRNNTIIGNSTSNNDQPKGGGIYALSRSTAGKAGDVQLYTNIIAGNEAEFQGGGVYVEVYSHLESAGQVYLTNNTITGNSLLEPGSGGGAFIDTGGDVCTTVSVYNNIIWGNLEKTYDGSDDVHLKRRYTCSVYTSQDYNDLDTLRGDSWSEGSGLNNINTDPLFVDEENDNYHLRTGSPCIGEGTLTPPGGSPLLDTDGVSRPFGGTVDIGADEYDPANPPCANRPARVVDGANYTDYYSIEDAYNNAAMGSTIKLQEYLFTEDVLFGMFGQNIITTIKGGYNCDYNNDTNTGYTTIDGSLTIKDGNITVENLIIK